MNINNSLDSDLKIVNDLTNKVLSEEKIHPIELDLLKDALKNLYKEVLKIESYPQKEVENYISDKKQEEVISPFIEKEIKYELKIQPEEEEIIENEKILEEKQAAEEKKYTVDSEPEDDNYKEEEIENNLPKPEIENIQDTHDEIFFDFEKREFEDIQSNEQADKNATHDISIKENNEPEKKIAGDDLFVFERKEEIIEERIIIEEKVDDSKHVTIAEKLSSVSSTIANTIVTESKNTIADKVSKEKISNIKLAIGINDKFFFINRLFDGDVNFYNETIEKFNNFSSLNDARILLQLLINKYGWDFEDEAFKKFEDIIERRY
ncbi:MAG: hypothetical protein LBP67_10795 [Bacteroidales bacterium]|jgi:hypothetical protein|nr:hypothetical protein [Bacteroidales bacterium]